MSPILPASAALAAAALLLALPARAAERPAERPSRPRLCPEDAPEGVRLPPQPGCGRPDPRAGRRAEDGFRDLGDGVRLKVGGRVGASYGARP